MKELIIWCPWCRVNPKVKLGRLQHDQLHGDPYQGVVVYCENPKCPVRPKLEAGDIYNGGLTKARSEAIAAWNIRPVEDALREELKDSLCWIMLATSNLSNPLSARNAMRQLRKNIDALVQAGVDPEVRMEGLDEVQKDIEAALRGAGVDNEG